MFSLASIVHHLFDMICGLSLLVLDQTSKTNSFHVLHQFTCTRQALHFAILETVCCSHAQKLIYLPVTLLHLSEMDLK